MSARSLYDYAVEATANILAREGPDDAMRAAERYEHALGIDRNKLMDEARKLQFTPREAV